MENPASLTMWTSYSLWTQAIRGGMAESFPLGEFYCPPEEIIVQEVLRAQARTLQPHPSSEWFQGGRVPRQP